MDSLKRKIEYLLEKNQDKIIELIEHMYEYEPHTVERMLEHPKDIEHITNRHEYDELINKIKWADGAKRGAKWSVDDIKRYSKINFDNSDFTLYDYAYLVNMLYAKGCKYIQDASTYLKLAQSLLEDEDIETKLYHGAYARQKHNAHHDEESRHIKYDPYEVEDRRRGHRLDKYDEEDRRRYYKESNMGFRNY